MGRGADTRERILAEARQLFAEKGFDGATTAQIARRAGVSEGAIYRHFQDKKDLFIHCVTPAISQILEQGIIDAVSAGDLRSAVRAMMAARLRLLEQHIDSINILFTEALYHPELGEMLVERMLLGRAERLASALLKLQGSGELKRPLNPLIFGPGMTAAIWVIFNLRDRFGDVQNRLRVPISDQNLLDDLTDFVLYGIAGQPPEGEQQR